MPVRRLLLLAVVFPSAPVFAADPPPVVVKYESAEASKAAYDGTVAPFLAKHCAGCHNDKKAEGDLNFAKLGSDMKASPSAARWVVVLEKLATRVMQPESRPRPDDDSVRAVSQWVHAEMKRANKHTAKRETYSNGNTVDHAQLFDPKQPAPFSSAPQARRLSPELYAGLVADFSKDLVVGQPFTPDGKTTFKDMGAVKIDEPVADQLLRNALALVNRQLTGGPGRKGTKEFAPLLDPKTPPADSQIAEAIAHQFAAVLKRKPTAAEATRYAAFFRKAVTEGGPTGAKYALASVLLLPEAVFRLQVGDGQPDAEGRVRLAPRTIAFAIPSPSPTSGLTPSCSPPPTKGN